MSHVTSTLFIAGRSYAGEIEESLLNAFLDVVFSTRIIIVHLSLNIAYK